MKQALLKITGKVQGVFYRAAAEVQAEKYGLNGYARNMPDGSVQCLIQGEDISIEEFIKWAKVGPPKAKVDNVKVEYQGIKESYSAFEIY